MVVAFRATRVACKLGFTIQGGVDRVDSIQAGSRLNSTAGFAPEVDREVAVERGYSHVAISSEHDRTSVAMDLKRQGEAEFRGVVSGNGLGRPGYCRVHDVRNVENVTG